MFEDTYKTIAGISEGIYKEKGSKFIALAYPVSSEKEIKGILTQLKKEYHDARHICYAYILGYDKAAYRINDDGEPSGTAGKPIYGQLLSNDLTNVLVAVIRYFGGTKLGVSGLINAYKEATKDVLGNVQIIEKIVFEFYQLYFDYNMMNNIMKVLKEEQLEQSNQQFELQCQLDIAVRVKDSIRIVDLFTQMQGVSIQFLRTL